MLKDFMKKPVWGRPEEGKHTIVIKDWLYKAIVSKNTGETIEFIECATILDNERELTHNFFEKDLHYFTSALINKHFKKGHSPNELFDLCVKEATEIECWVKHNKKDDKEYTNFYWFEPTEDNAPTVSEAELSAIINEANLPL